MWKTYLILLAIILAPGLVLGEYNAPSEHHIYLWWDPPEGMSKAGMFVDKVVPITLTGNERAWLARVSFPERGRNFQLGSLLVRPKLQEAREIDLVGHTFGVIRNNLNEAAVIWTETFASGQGTTDQHKRVLYFDGWKPVILYQVSFGNNLGDCGEEREPARKCYAKEVAWTFKDLDNDSKDDLIEVHIQQEGPRQDELLWATKVNIYLIKDGKFIPTSPSTSYDPNRDHRFGE
jgi:hypothetical protein